jgi:hypothetical protein
VRRRFEVGLALVAALACLLPAPGRAAASDEAELAARIAAERSARGLPPLAAGADLAAVARAWSARMARDGAIAHNPDLPAEVEGWTVLGENVGRGPSAADVHRAFMGSAEHRVIVLDGRFTEVGVGVVASRGMLYVTEVFARRSRPAGATAGASRSVPRPMAGPPALVAVTGRISAIDLAPSSRVVELLVRLASLDAGLATRPPTSRSP